MLEHKNSCYRAVQARWIYTDANIQFYCGKYDYNSITLRVHRKYIILVQPRILLDQWFLPTRSSFLYMTAIHLIMKSGIQTCKTVVQCSNKFLFYTVTRHKTKLNCNITDFFGIVWRQVCFIPNVKSNTICIAFLFKKGNFRRHFFYRHLTTLSNCVPYNPIICLCVSLFFKRSDDFSATRVSTRNSSTDDPIRALAFMMCEHCCWDECKTSNWRQNNCQRRSQSVNLLSWLQLKYCTLSWDTNCKKHVNNSTRKTRTFLNGN